MQGNRSGQTRGCLKPGPRGHCGSEFAGVNKLPPRFKCTIYAQTFATSTGGLTQHVQHINAKKKHRYKCEACGKVFCIRSDYYDHVAAHTQITAIKLNVCIVCKKRFTYTRGLRAHASICHPKFR